MFYQVAPGRPAWVFKITLAASYESKLCCICEMLSLSKSHSIHLVYHSDQDWLLTNQIGYYDSHPSGILLSNRQVDYTCIARNSWMTIGLIWNRFDISSETFWNYHISIRQIIFLNFTLITEILRVIAITMWRMEGDWWLIIT